MNQQISLQNTGTIRIFQLQKAQSTKSKENQTNQSNKKPQKVILKKTKNKIAIQKNSRHATVPESQPTPASIGLS